MKKGTYGIDYDKWGHIITSSELLIACFVFVIEVANNILLYVTRSQGYGPDTIVQKLIRYLVITSIFNFGMVFASKMVERRVQSKTAKKYLLMLFTTLICTNVAYSHYQFATTLVIFVVPIIISILYEDTGLSAFVMVISLLGETVAVVARATDPLYNKDIGPEAAIAYSFIVSVFIFAKIINTTLIKRRGELQDAIITVEESKASAERMELSLKMLETLAGTIDAKDKYTNGHSMRVAMYATKIATALGWDEKSITKLKYEAILHDIGKIGVPDGILNKPSRLTDTEFELIKSHTLIGAEILKNMIVFPNATEVAKHHHERYDGKGYPNSLEETETPINARIVCIADAYDAMNSDRIYRKALSPEIIRSELVKGRGSQFDPQLLDVFLQLFDEKQLEISTDELISEQIDEQQQNVMNDIESVIARLNSMDEQRSSFYDFEKFYIYMRNIGQRYNRSIEVIEIDLVPTTENAPLENITTAANLLEVAIRKNIRAVDVYSRYSATKHLLILLDAGVDNVHIVQSRIEYDYNVNDISSEFKLNFALNESSVSS